VTLRGTLKNFNTIEEFKNADKQAIFDQLADEVCCASLRIEKM
jgi:ubiquitin-like modifier-activating enzyme ATG7